MRRTKKARRLAALKGWRKRKRGGSRKRRRNPSPFMSLKGRTKRTVNRRRRKTRKPAGRRRRMTVYQTGSGNLRRARKGIGWTRRGKKKIINPRRRYRRRRNPGIVSSVKRTMRQFRLNQAVPILGGLAGAVALKPVVSSRLIPMLPVSIAPWVEKYFGVITITAGWFISNRSRKKMVKSVGLGMIVGGVYDLIATNFADLPFIPKISPATAGASIGTGQGFTTVGSNISSVQAPTIVGADMDVDDMWDNI